MQDIDILLAINAALVTCGRMQKVTCLDVGVAQEIAGLLQNVCDKVCW